MTEKLTPQEFEAAAHRGAYNLLFKALEFQPQLMAGSGIHKVGGNNMGEFLNGLYDQLVELSRKNLKGEGV